MSPNPRPVVRAILLLVIGLVAALANPAPSHGAGVTITIRDSFDPDTLTIPPGTRVTWVNASGNRHRVRTTSAPSKVDSGNLEPGERFSATLSAPGTYAYRDEREPDDRSFWATIIVKQGAVPSDGGSGSSSEGGVAAVPTSASVGMGGRAFGPASVTIATGGIVTWRNDDDRAHTVSATGQAFDSGTMEPGATFRQAFTSVGSFAYRCVIHPEMTGTVVVRAGTGSAAATPAPPSASPSVVPPTPAPTATPPAQPGPSDAATGSIRVVDFAFELGALAIATGAEVTVVNAGEAPHTITAADGSFDSGTIPSGGTWSTTFAEPGTFAFLCAIHPEMTGVLEVTGAAVSATGAEPNASPAALAPAAIVPGAIPSPAAVADTATTGTDASGRASQPSDLVGLFAAVLLTGAAAVLFMRTIAGIGRRPDHG